MPNEVIEKFSRQVGFAGTRYLTHRVFVFMHSITIYNLVLSLPDETSAEGKSCTYFQGVRMWSRWVINLWFTSMSY